MFDGHALFPADKRQQLDRRFRGKDTHQVVIERQKEDAGTIIALSACTAAKLVVDTPGLMPLCTENMQPAQGSDPFAQFDVGSATGHVRRNRHVAAFGPVPRFMLLTGLFHDHCFPRVLLGIEHFMLDTVTARQGLREGFTFFDADGTDQHGTSGTADLMNFLNNCVEFFLHRFID